MTATAPGFGVSAAQGTTITSAASVQMTINLSPEPPGSLSGRIVSATTGSPIGDVKVHLKVNGADVVTPVTSQPFFTTPTVGQAYNYRFDNAPTGTVDVVPEAPGYTIVPTSRTVTIVTGQETMGVNFQLSSLQHVPVGPVAHVYSVRLPLPEGRRGGHQRPGPPARTG